MPSTMARAKGCGFEVCNLATGPMSARRQPRRFDEATRMSALRLIAAESRAAVLDTINGLLFDKLANAIDNRLWRRISLRDQRFKVFATFRFDGKLALPRFR